MPSRAVSESVSRLPPRLIMQQMSRRYERRFSQTLRAEKLLTELRRFWLHMVSRTGVCEVYVGPNRDGPWCNCVSHPLSRTTVHHEIAVRMYSTWFLTQRKLMATARARLVGRTLGCHCRTLGFDLPCHAEVLAAVANCTVFEYHILLHDSVGYVS